MGKDLNAKVSAKKIAVIGFVAVLAVVTAALYVGARAQGQPIVRGGYSEMVVEQMRHSISQRNATGLRCALLRFDFAHARYYAMLLWDPHLELVYGNVSLGIAVVTGGSSRTSGSKFQYVMAKTTDGWVVSGGTLDK